MSTVCHGALLAWWALTPVRAAGPPADDAQVPEVPQVPAEDEAPSKRDLRRAARQARWEQAALPPEADFFVGHTELTFRLAFNGTDPGPFSLLTALSGWNELGLVVDHGVASWRDFTVGIGAETHVAYALLLGAFAGGVADYDDEHFGWQMWDAGGSLRVTMHFTRLASVDPYLVAALGAGAWHVDAQHLTTPPSSVQGITDPYLRVALGGGLTWRLAGGPWVIGTELRYLLTTRFGSTERFLFEASDDLAVFAFAPIHRPPKGFSWSLRLGYRF